jgi:hypothetical protein
MMTGLKWFFAFISTRFTIEYAEPIWNWDHNVIKVINLNMNIGFSNWHIWSIDPTKMKFLFLFQFDTLLLTSKHPKHIST